MKYCQLCEMYLINKLSSFFLLFEQLDIISIIVYFQFTDYDKNDAVDSIFSVLLYGERLIEFEMFKWTFQIDALKVFKVVKCRRHRPLRIWKTFSRLTFTFMRNNLFFLAPLLHNNHLHAGTNTHSFVDITNNFDAVFTTTMALLLLSYLQNRLLFPFPLQWT